MPTPNIVRKPVAPMATLSPFKYPVPEPEQNNTYLNSLDFIRSRRKPLPVESASGNTNGLNGAISTVAGIGSGLIDSASQQTSKDISGREYTTQDNGSAFASGALKGAAAGAAFGPIGMGIGAAVMGTVGVVGNNMNNVEVERQKKEVLDAKIKNSAMEASNKYENDVAQGFKHKGQEYVTMYKNGGYIKKYPDGGELYNTKRAKELGYVPDETGHLPSVDNTNGMWLKSKQHPTAWMELLEYSLNPELQKELQHPVVNEEGYFGKNQLQYLPKKALGGNMPMFPKGGKFKPDIVQTANRKVKLPTQVKRLDSDNLGVNVNKKNEVLGGQPVSDLEQWIDPTGITNYPDLINAIEEKRWNEVPIEVLGSLPMVGKFGKMLKAVKTSRNVPIGKALPLIDDLNDTFKEYAGGGLVNNPQYEVEGEEVVQGQDTNLENQEDLASDMTKAIGPTHEGGGVKGEGGERVFSDRLNASDSLIFALSALKMQVPKNATYATVAEKLGRYKSKFEDKLESHNSLQLRTGKVMVDRIDSAIEATFQDQEMTKQMSSNTTKMKYGGKLPKFYDGGGFNPYLDTRTSNRKATKAVDMTEEELENEQVMRYDMIKYNKDMNPSYGTTVENMPNGYDVNAELKAATRFQPQESGDTRLPVIEAVGNNFKLANNQSSSNNPSVVTTSAVAKDSDTKRTRLLDKLKSNDFITPEQGINTAVYLANLNNANKQKTSFVPETAAPTYMRNFDMLPSARYAIKQQADALDKSIDNNSSNPQDRFARKMAIRGEAMDRTNQAVIAQQQSNNQTNNINTSISNEYKNRAAENRNKYLEMKTTGENAILTNKQAATNAWLQGIMGNLASSRAYKVENEKMAIARMEGGRGTADRSKIPLWLGGSQDENNVPTDDELVSYGKNYPAKQQEILKKRPDLKNKFGKGGYLNMKHKSYSN